MKAPPGFSRHSGPTFVGWIREGFQPPADLLERPEEIGNLPGAEHLLDCRGRQIHRLPLVYKDTPQN